MLPGSQKKRTKQNIYYPNGKHITTFLIYPLTFSEDEGGENLISHQQQKWMVGMSATAFVSIASR